MKQRMSIGLSILGREALQRIAHKYRLSLAWMHRQAIVEFLARCEVFKNRTLLLSGDAKGGKE